MKVGDLAQAVNTARQTLYNAEAGWGTLSIEVLQRVADVLTRAGNEKDPPLPPVTLGDLVRRVVGAA